MPPPDPRRKPYGQQNPSLDRKPNLEQILLLKQEAVNRRDSETKRLIFLEGDAGIGKTWLLGNLKEEIGQRFPTWKVLGIYDAYQFLNDNPYRNFIHFMNACAGIDLHTLVEQSPPTFEDVQRCAGLLELNLRNRANEPLIIIFDELEFWVSVDDHKRGILGELFRIVWRVLLRQSAMPCIIICAGRRQPEYKDVLLKRTLYTFKLEGFTFDELKKKLPAPNVPEIFHSQLQTRADGNPWIAELLIGLLSEEADALTEPDKKEKNLRWLFDQVIDGRLDETLHETLYHLARKRPDGFFDDDELLPEQDTIIPRLIRTSLLSFDIEKKRYRVVRVLSSLFKEPTL